MNNHPATVDDLLVDQLEAADLPKDAHELVLAALLGEEELQQALGGPAPPAPPRSTSADAPEPAGAYLTRIEVRGFRGVGETATLDFVPGPGLTIVTGRNGSGKSSFAEAAELALTGDNLHWAGRSQQWRDGWRNLHVGGERHIRVGLGLDGQRGGATVECHWADGADLDERQSFLQRAGQPRTSVEELGWRDPMHLFRPFLSYAELGRLLSGKPSEMYDSLHNVLGLGRLAEIENALKAARKDSDQTRKRAGAELPALRELLAAHPDRRAREAEQLLAARTVDLDALAPLATDTGTDDDGPVVSLRAMASLTLPGRDQVVAHVERLQAARQRVTELSETPAAQARSLAGLLRQALQHQEQHPDQPCPVCGGRVLDTDWAARAGDQQRRLTGQAEQLEQAHQQLRTAHHALGELTPATPPAVAAPDPDLAIDQAELRSAWHRWDALKRADDPERSAAEALARFDAVAGALAPVRDAASRALEARRQAWQPVAEQLRAWTELARSSRLAERTHAAARKAVDWLRTVGEEIRNQQLAPLATEAEEIWALLRQDSNVDLGAVRLAGAGTHRRVELNLAVDGEPGAALGVMSQGELHALALSLFLPRATLAASPFRFLLIDDPVQSMDPAKVHGLARALERVAANRQVIVFTHDDRLPSAIRQLGISAHLRVVSRREHSQVTVDVDEHGDPALRYLADAWAVARDEHVDSPLQSKAVCVYVRDAIEARCHDLVTAAGVHAGRPIHEIEAELAEPGRVRETLALALFGDRGREGELDNRLRSLHPRAPGVVRDANRGVHGGPVGGPLTELVRDARVLVDKLGGLR